VPGGRSLPRGKGTQMGGGAGERVSSDPLSERFAVTREPPERGRTAAPGKSTPSCLVSLVNPLLDISLHGG
jgi:hypothetical protein